VSEASNRIGVRLTARHTNGASTLGLLSSHSLGELDSMALVRGAVQLTPSGELVVMLADHPTTGGYPVIAVVHAEDVDSMGQYEPTSSVRFLLVEESNEFA
jgi:allophanate hydrolase subunit 2